VGRIPSPVTVANEPTLTPAQKLAFLNLCPDLAGAVDERIARLFEVRRYERDQVFYAPFRPGARTHVAKCLWAVLHGHVVRREITGSRRAFGPQSVFGEHFVVTWNAVRTKELQDHPPPPPGAAVAAEPTVVLELSPERFADAFLDPSGATNELYARVLRAQRVNNVAPEVVTVLAGTPELANVATDELYHLLEGAEIVDAKNGDVILPAREVPEDYWVLLEGTLAMKKPGKSAIDASLTGRKAIGVTELVNEQPMLLEASTRGAARLVRLSGQVFRRLFAHEPNFQRAIVRSARFDASKPREGEAQISTLLFLPGPELARMRPDVADPRVFGKIVDLLAERIACQLFDWVLVLHVVSGDARQPVVRSYETDFHVEPSEAPWVEHRWIALAPGESLAERVRAAEEQACARGKADVVLVDVSALDPRGAPASLDLTGIPHKIVHVSASADAIPPIQLLTGDVDIIPTAVLEPEEPSAGIGEAIARIERALAGEGVRAKLEALGEMLKSRAAATKQKVDAAAANPITTGPSFSTWPIRAVRVRFREALLAALPGAKSPASLDDLGLAPAERAAATRTLDRWARGVTGRRVGITLGGGGSYGDVHVPLLKKLAASNVPIDLVAGASVGSTVGSYYATLGVEGLDLFWAHRGLLFSAMMLGLVSSAFFEWAIAFDLGSIALNQTEVPFFPVVTDGDVGVEWDVRSGTYARGVRASGSLPPMMGPTVIGDRRYLDGGLVANVPVDVLREEGAGLVIASNPVPAVGARPRRSVGFFPGLSELWAEMNPFLRLDDVKRAFPLIFRAIGDTQTSNADVTYRAAAGDTTLGSISNDDFVEDAGLALALNQAVAEVVTKWRAMQRHPPARVRLQTQANGASSIEVRGWIGFRLDEATIDPLCTELLEELASFLNAHAELAEVGVTVYATKAELADGRAEALVDALERLSVKRGRLVPSGKVAAKLADERVELTVLKRLLSPQEIAAANEKLRAELAAVEAKFRAANASALSRGLVLAAAWHGVRGDLQLGRLLALEAAAIRSGHDVDRVLRMVLARRGWMKKLFPVAGDRSVSHLVWSADGRRFATGSADGIVRVWDAATTEDPPRPTAELSHVGASDTGITGLAFAPGGKLLATAGFDQTIRVHAVGDDGGARTVAKGEVGTWDQWGIAFAPTGDRLLGTAAGTRRVVGVWVWDEATGKMTTVAQLSHPADVVHAAWCPHGERVATTTADGAVYVWKAAGESPAPAPIAREPGTVVAWCGDRLAVARGKGALVFDLPSGAEQGATLTIGGHTGTVRGVAWSPDGSRLATSSDDGSTRVWDAKTGAFLMMLRGYEGPMTGVAFEPAGGGRALTWSQGGAVVVWDVTTGEPLASMTGHGGAVRCAHWSTDASLVLTCSSDGTARLWDHAASGLVVHRGHDAGIWAAACRPGDPATVITASVDGAARVWSTRTGALLRVLATDAQLAGEVTLPVGWSADGEWIAIAKTGAAQPELLRAGFTPRPAPAFARSEALASVPAANGRALFSPDGALLAVQRGRAWAVWETATGALVVDRVEDADLLAIAWDPQGKTLAIGLWLGGGSLALVDVRAKHTRALGGSTDGIWAIAWSPDGARIAGACNDGHVHVHDAATGGIVAEIPHGAPVRTLAWSPDGRMIATGDSSRTGRVWSAATYLELGVADGHADTATAIAWSPDSRFFASAGDGGHVHLWTAVLEGETMRWSPVASLDMHRGRVSALAFTSDGTRLVTVGDDGLARVHPVAFEALVDAVGAIQGRNEMTDEEWEQYMGQSEPRRPTWPR
jgi:WD40 repeat protein/predicted acylesterase/phospholipase RssA